MKRSAIHFNLDQEGDNVVAQVLHRVAAVIAPVQRDVCGNSQPIVVGAVRILSNRPDGCVLSVLGSWGWHDGHCSKGRVQRQT